MTVDQIKSLQADLARMGFYRGIVDGVWGDKSAAAWLQAVQAVARAAGSAGPSSTAPPVSSAPAIPMLAWGARVSQVFRDRILWTAAELQMPADGASWLIACIAWESAETFSPAVTNMAGSGATGLIQFMPATALQLGTTVEALARLTAEDQINWVYRYFKPYAGRLQSLGDVYMAILWPAGIGKPDDFVLWNRATRPTTYRQNAGLDIDRNGAITKAEAVTKVREKLTKGLLPANALPLPAAQKGNV